MKEGGNKAAENGPFAVALLQGFTGMKIPF
jgi:hypothetical protein